MLVSWFLHTSCRQCQLNTRLFLLYWELVLWLGIPIVSLVELITYIPELTLCFPNQFDEIHFISSSLLANVCLRQVTSNIFIVIIVVNVIISPFHRRCCCCWWWQISFYTCAMRTEHTFPSYFSSYKLNFHIEIIQYVWDVAI